MRTNLLFTIFILALMTSSSFGQRTNYFYGNKTRYELTADSIEAIVLPRSGTAAVNANDLSRSSQFRQAQAIHNRREALVKLTDKSHLKNNNSDYDILPVFKHGDFPMIPTGEIVFKPKKGVSYKQILDYCKGKLNFVKQTAYGTTTVTPSKMSDLLKTANALYESGLVEWSEPDFLVEIVRNQVTPTDQFYAQQYYMNQANNIDINAPQAWGVSRGINTVRVALIDDGAEAHEDLNPRVVAGFTPTNANGLGAPTNNPPPAAETTIGHGMACAGIIAATHDNVGVAGVAPCSQIVPINIFNSWTLNTSFPVGQQLRWLETPQNIAAGINWAWDPLLGNAQVLSNSWGYNTTNAGAIPQSDQIITAINNARTQGRGNLGCVVVFASGNSHQSFSGVTFPANVNGVVTVGAINKTNGTIHNYSSRGAEMDLVAPSGPVPGDLVTTDRTGALGFNAGANSNYGFTFNGTSAACPQVSGVAALMLSVNGALTEAQVVTFLRNTATDMGTPGFDNTYGFGRLNAQGAIQAAMPTIAGGSVICTSQVYQVNGLPQGATVSWSSTWNSAPYPTLVHNSPVANQLTINNTYMYPSATALTATITGTCRTQVLTRAIGSDYYSQVQTGTYVQEACTFHNTGNPASSGNLPSTPNTPLYLRQGCMTTISLSNMGGKTVTNTGGSTPLYWSYNSAQSKLYLQLPYMSGGIPFTFTISGDGACQQKTLLFFSYSQPYYPYYTFSVAPNPASSDYLTINATLAEEERTSTDAAYANVLEYSVNIMDLSTGQVIGKPVKYAGNTGHRVDISKLKKGLYNLQIFYTDKIQNIKFVKE
jgi:serine protease